MVAIGFRFPAGRLHATPWGRHVNEGVPEWPPSPWRILRSLVAAWKVKLSELSEREAQSILQKLTTPPQFQLPSATMGHTRHYMRWYKKGPEDQTLVFDAFVCVGRDSETVALWPATEMDGGQREILAKLLDRLGYLGRAESWCEARLLTDEEAAAVRPNSRPLNGAGADGELIRVLCADPDTAFSGEYVRDRGYDPAWNLCMETAQLHSEKWSDPPGSKWITYARRQDCFRPRPAAKMLRRREHPRMQVARYAIDSSVLPLASETLPLTEHVRAVLMGIYGRITETDGERGRSPGFSGKDSDGRRIEGHVHAYYLPADEDGDGRLDHLTVVAEGGFDRDELTALDRLRVLRRDENSPDVNFLLLGLGTLETFALPVLGPSRQWVSATPFLVTRHPKKNGTKRDPKHLLADTGAFVELVLREELERFVARRHFTWRVEEIGIRPCRDKAGVFRVQPAQWAAAATGPNLRPLEFKRFRSRKRDDDGARRRSGAFLLEFPEQVRGPVCLGHSAHFGMGLFLPVQSSDG